MKKIPTLFVRDPENMKLVSREVHPDCQWVIDGEGVATQKLDGTCCMIRVNRLFKRHTVKRGKASPPDFEAATEIDPNTGKQEGWVPVGDGPEDAVHREAFGVNGDWADGTYELIGPKVQGNPEESPVHALVAHNKTDLVLDDLQVPRDFDGLRAWLDTIEIEGIVWHHPDGRMAKIKKKDFGLARKLVLQASS